MNYASNLVCPPPYSRSLVGFALTVLKYRHRTRRRCKPSISLLPVSEFAAKADQTTDQDRPIVNGVQEPPQLKIEIPANRYAPESEAFGRIY